MKYFLDTEFIEDGKTIDLISIGIVCEDGREYYAINVECDFKKASDWVMENVLYPIGLDGRGFYAPLSQSPNDAYGISFCDAKVKKQIAHEVAVFLECQAETLDNGKTAYSLKKDVEKPEFWAYHADYDWVVFCQLFGTMMDLPTGFPMYCKDIKQLCDSLGSPELLKQGNEEHNALADARWNKQTWEFLTSLSNK